MRRSSIRIHVGRGCKDTSNGPSTCKPFINRSIHFVFEIEEVLPLPPVIVTPKPFHFATATLLGPEIDLARLLGSILCTYNIRTPVYIPLHSLGGRPTTELLWRKSYFN